MIGSGLLHGYWTDRWPKSVEPTEAAARFVQFPTSFGDWEMQEIEGKLGSVDAALAGSLQRQYVNRRTGQKVAVVLVCGRFGPVSIHTPEACYGASGYLVGGRTRVAAPGGSGRVLDRRRHPHHGERGDKSSHLLGLERRHRLHPGRRRPPHLRPRARCCTSCTCSAI